MRIERLALITLSRNRYPTDLQARVGREKRSYGYYFEKY